MIWSAWGQRTACKRQFSPSTMSLGIKFRSWAWQQAPLPAEPSVHLPAPPVISNGFLWPCMTNHLWGLLSLCVPSLNPISVSSWSSLESPGDETGCVPRAVLTSPPVFWIVFSLFILTAKPTCWTSLRLSPHHTSVLLELPRTLWSHQCGLCCPRACGHSPVVLRMFGRIHCHRHIFLKEHLNVNQRSVHRALGSEGHR